MVCIDQTQPVDNCGEPEPPICYSLLSVSNGVYTIQESQAAWTYISCLNGKPNPHPAWSSTFTTTDPTPYGIVKVMPTVTIASYSYDGTNITITFSISGFGTSPDTWILSGWNGVIGQKSISNPTNLNPVQVTFIGTTAQNPTPLELRDTDYGIDLFYNLDINVAANVGPIDIHSNGPNGIPVEILNAIISYPDYTSLTQNPASIAIDYAGTGNPITTIPKTTLAPNITYSQIISDIASGTSVNLSGGALQNLAIDVRAENNTVQTFIITQSDFNSLTTFLNSEPVGYGTITNVNFVTLSINSTLSAIESFLAANLIQNVKFTVVDSRIPSIPVTILSNAILSRGDQQTLFSGLQTGFQVVSVANTTSAVTTTLAHVQSMITTYLSTSTNVYANITAQNGTVLNPVMTLADWNSLLSEINTGQVLVSSDHTVLTNTGATPTKTLQQVISFLDNNVSNIGPLTITAPNGQQKTGVILTQSDYNLLKVITSITISPSPGTSTTSAPNTTFTALQTWINQNTTLPNTEFTIMDTALNIPVVTNLILSNSDFSTLQSQLPSGFTISNQTATSLSSTTSIQTILSTITQFEASHPPPTNNTQFGVQDSKNVAIVTNLILGNSDFSTLQSQLPSGFTIFGQSTTTSAPNTTIQTVLTDIQNYITTGKKPNPMISTNMIIGVGIAVSAAATIAAALLSKGKSKRKIIV